MAISELENNHIHNFAYYGSGDDYNYEVAKNLGCAQVVMSYAGTPSQGVGRLLTHDLAGRALLLETSNSTVLRRCYINSNGNWLFNTARGTVTDWTPVDAADVTWCKSFLFGINQTVIDGLNTTNFFSNFASAFDPWTGSGSLSSYYNFESVYVVSALAAATIQSMRYGAIFGATGFDGIFLDNGGLHASAVYTTCSLASPVHATNNAVGGKGSYSDWLEGRAVFLHKVISECAALIAPGSGRPPIVTINIWQGRGIETNSARAALAVKDLQKRWTSGQCRATQYYLEAGWTNTQNSANSSVPTGYDYAGLPAYANNGWGFIPARKMSQHNTFLKEPHDFSDILGAVVKAASQGSWNGWYGGTGAGMTDDGVTAANILLRVIVNWDNIRGLSISDRQWTNTVPRSYQSAYSRATTGQFIYSFAPSGLPGNVAANELFVVFSSLADSVPLLTGQTTIVSAYSCNTRWTKGASVASSLSIVGGEMTLTSSTLVGTPLRITLNTISEPQPPVSDYDLHDTFVGSSGTPIASHTPDVNVLGGAWVSPTSVITLDGAGAVQSSTAQTRFYLDSGGTNQDVTIVASTNGADESFNVDVRCIGTGETPDESMRFAVFPVDNVARIYKRVDNVTTQLASTQYFFTATNQYTLRFVASGTTFTAYINGSQVLQVSDSSVATGTQLGAGFRTRSTGASRIYSLYANVEWQVNRTIEPSRGVETIVYGQPNSSEGTQSTIVTSTIVTSKYGRNTSKKPSAVRQQINRAHPLARGLRAFYLLNENSGVMYDAVQGSHITTAATLPPSALLSGGVGRSFTGSQVAYSAANPLPTSNYAWTVAARLRGTIDGAATKLAFGVGAPAQTFRRYIGFKLVNATLNYFIDLTANVDIGGVSTVGQWYTIAGVTESATSHKVYRDGVLVTTSAIDITGSQRAELNAAVIGGAYYGGVYQDEWIGEMSWGGVWDRPLSGYENMLLHVAPFELFIQPARRAVLQVSTVFNDIVENPVRGLETAVGKGPTTTNVSTFTSPVAGVELAVGRVPPEVQEPARGISYEVGGTFVEGYRDWSAIGAATTTTWGSL